VSHLELLDAELQNFQIELSESQRILLGKYCDELVHWNQKINLTALAGASLVRRLVVEPVWIARKLQMRESLLDVGSGNGSPAIPFQIVCPSLLCDLVEVRAKRAAFLRHLTATLKLSNSRIHRARFEDVVSALRTPRWISLQAVRLSKDLIDAIASVADQTTTIVWITSVRQECSLVPTKALTVPFTDTKVLLFRLDLS
jgi:16S rRNA (guanine(527)-N(7))-methyltransferase RsmG